MNLQGGVFLFESFVEDLLQSLVTSGNEGGRTERKQMRMLFSQNPISLPQQWEFQQSNDVIKKVFETGYEFKQF